MFSESVVLFLLFVIGMKICIVVCWVVWCVLVLLVSVGVLWFVVLGMLVVWLLLLLLWL